MKKFYSCLPVFLLIGCAQVPPPFLREQTGTATWRSERATGQRK
ncbi:hypothetical protein I5Z35_002001 [Salmonella enterica subsp. enterica serovar Paratyphi B]|nr:hypothetical protein [Salmonella enterica subsp. enterica serovar Paratyphi B]